MNALLRKAGRIACAAMTAQLLWPAAPAHADPIDVTVPCDVPALIDAINVVNAAGLGVIRLTPQCDYVLTGPASVGVYGPNGLPIVTAQISILGSGATIRRAADAPRFRLLEVTESGAVRIADLRLVGGDAGRQPGGGILVRGQLGLRKSTLQDNTAAAGGALANLGGSVTLVDSTVTGNQAGIESAAPAQAAAMPVGGVPGSRVRLSRRAAAAPAGYGGGVLNRGELHAVRTTIGGNRARVGGGVANEQGGKATFRNTTISGNLARTRGGGLYNAPGGYSRVLSTTISRNKAGDTGGGVFNGYVKGAVRLSGSTVTANKGDNCAPAGSVSRCTA